ncbi:MAG: hypothetical protein B7Y43_11370 [Sphingomonas sp. 28-62-20]|uniref:DUF3047 domain-containing protein n=1 Tax=Sphingomonas sp. 28-62-20 TaxID=1970433 RepID=UPI000BD19ECE|nr:MAG: hypothetical protein B7Y43_11370 [Sphingomonas sp. 28-62-20]
MDDHVPPSGLLSRRQMLAGGAALAVAPVAAQAAPPKGWRSVGFPFLRANSFDEIGSGVIQVDGKRASSILYRRISIDLGQTPRLGWRWRVDNGPPATDLAVRGKDDRALAVIIGFPFDPATASAIERSQHRAMRFLLGHDAPGRSLHYVWGSGLTRGTVIRPQKTDAHRFVVLRSAGEPAGIWHTESVDVAADYRRIFGEPPPQAVQLAISSDGDDTHSTVHAAIGGFAWS